MKAESDVAMFVQSYLYVQVWSGVVAEVGCAHSSDARGTVQCSFEPSHNTRDKSLLSTLGGSTSDGTPRVGSARCAGAAQCRVLNAF